MLPPKKLAFHSVLFLSLLLLSRALCAQQSVHFENIGFDEAVEKAKAEKKIVFVDVRGMNPNALADKVEKDVLTLDSVAAYFNQHIICIRINMGTEEGKKFAPKLAMLMYPVYVFHGRNGDQLEFTNAGLVSKDPAALMQKARASVEIDKLKNANTRSITFNNGSWNDVLKQAKAANKLIFLDAQTTWCRPCIMMAKDVFTLDRVADYYNENFINVTMDMEKGDGPQLVKKYGIKAYPTFLYIDGDGNLVHRDGGYQEADKFLENGHTAISKKSGSTSTPSSTSFSSIPAARIVPSPPNGSTLASTTSPSPNPPASPSAPANSGIVFTQGSWASILARAKQDDQLIFVDANTSWCGPCKQMSREIFPQQAVASLYNRNFINVDLDMEKGEGIAFRKKYGIRAYPTFLFIDGDGNLVHKTVGSCDAASFRQHALDALSPDRNLQYLAAGYKEHQKEQTFIKNYLDALRDAYETGKADSIAVTYLEAIGSSNWIQPSNWQIIRDYVNDATSAPFVALVNSQPLFSQQFGAEPVEKKIYDTYLAWPRNYVSYPEKASPRLDKAGFDNFLAQLRSGPYSKKAEIESRSRLTVYFGLSAWKDYAATVNAMLAAHIVPMDERGAEWLFSYADIINRFSKDDKSVLADATQWARLISTGIEGIRPNDKATYMDLYATLLEKTGKKDQAIQVRKDIDQQQLADAKKNAPFQSLIRITPKQNTN